MKKTTVISATLLSLCSATASAEPYIHFGGGLDFVNNKHLSENEPALNLKAGLGIQLSQELALELDAVLKTTTTFKGSSTCASDSNASIKCSGKEKVSNQLTVGSVVYTHELETNQAFFKAGLAYIQSSLTSNLVAADNTEFKKDEKSNDFAGVFSAGIIFKQRHRIAGTLSTEYGSDDAGKYSFFGVEYNYLMPL